MVLYLIGLFGWATAVPLYGSVSRAWAGEIEVAFGHLPLWALGASMGSSVLWGFLADRRPEWTQAAAKVALVVGALCKTHLRNVFRKTEAGNRNELYRELMEREPFPEGSDPR